MLMKERRLLKNKAERVLQDLLEADGWEVYKRGMPDFACYRGTEFMLIEVKPNLSHNLKEHQYKLLAKLAKYGVPVFYFAASEKKFLAVTPPPSPD